MLCVWRYEARRNKGRAVERWLVDLPLSNQTRNHIHCGPHTVPREAEAGGIIQRNPLEHVEPMAKAQRKRDIFSFEELCLLFPKQGSGT